MNEILIWVWVGLFILAIFFEFITLDLVSIWFALAAIPAFILSLFSVEWYIQFAVFVILTLVLFLYTRPIIMKYLKTNEIKTNVDAIIGKIGYATSDIKPGVPGTAKVNNLEWTAISQDTVKQGEAVRILDIEGVKLIVEKNETKS